MGGAQANRKRRSSAPRPNRTATSETRSSPATRSKHAQGAGLRSRDLAAENSGLYPGGDPPFVLEQLRQRAPILYIHEENGRDAVMSRVRSEGYDPEELCNAGLLRLLEPSDGYLRAGTFVPDRMVDFMEAAILAFRASGHEKVLISGEMSWYLKRTPGTERMIEYEALLNKLLARHSEVTIVCNYDTHRMDGAVTLGALCSHTHVQLSDRLVQGFFAEA